MNTFELTFYVSDIPQGLADKLVDEYDAMSGQEHDGRYFVTVEADGVDCVSAAKNMHMQLCALGLQITRLVVDLVTRSDIAARLDVSRQAASNWARGARRGHFPAPVNSVAGGVWLWGDVHRWAVEKGVLRDEGVSYPTLADLDHFNGWLQGPCLDPWRVVEAQTAKTAKVTSAIPSERREHAWAGGVMPVSSSSVRA